MSNRYIHIFWLSLGLALITNLSAQYEFTRSSNFQVNTWPWQRLCVYSYSGSGVVEWNDNGIWRTISNSGSNQVKITGIVEGTPIDVNTPNTVPFAGTSRTIQYRWIQNPSEILTFTLPAPQSQLTINYNSTSSTASITLPAFYITFNSANYSHSITSNEPGDNEPQAPTHKELTLLLFNATDLPQNIMWGDKMITLQPGQNAVRYDGPIDANGFPTVGPADLVGSLMQGPDGRTYFASQIEYTGLDSGEIRWANPQPVPFSDPNPPPDAPRYEIIAPGNTSQGPTVIIHNSDGTRTITTLPALHPEGTTPLTSGGVATLTNPTQPNQQPNETNTFNNTTNNTTLNNSTTNVTNIYGTDPSADSTVQEMNQQGQDTTFADELVPDMPVELQDDLGQVRNSITEKLQAYKVLSSGNIPKADNFNVTYDCGRFGQLPITVDFTHPAVQIFRALILLCFTLVLSATLLKRLKV